MTKSKESLLNELLCNILEFQFENFHSHSHESNPYTPDSIITKEDIAKRAVELGQQTLSSVEHGYFSSLYDSQKIVEKYGLKLIFGTEFYYVKDRHEKDRTNSHLLALAKTKKGELALKSAISEANKTGYYGKPRVDEELLFNLPPEDVVITTACIASPLNKYGDEYARKFIQKAKKHFGDNFYLEVQPHTNIKQVVYNEKLLLWRKEFDVELILGIDSHYIYKEDAGKRDLFLKGKKIDYPEEDGFIIDYPEVKDLLERLVEQGVLSYDEIKESFDNSLIVRDFQGVHIKKDIKMPSLHKNLTHGEKVATLKQLLNKAWIEDRKEIPKSEWSKYIEAIKMETQIIVDTKMEDYFLMNEPVIKRAINKYGGVLTRTGRGSAPSMYINKLLGFTEVDRVSAPITLYPTRFMSYARIMQTKSLPDIDFNTSDPHPFIQATRDCLGEDNCYFMIAYGTMKESGAFRNYCRALGLNQDEFNFVGKNLDSFKNDKKWAPIIKESEMFLGVIDSFAPHPCAVLVLNEPISEEVGVIKIGDEMVALIDSGNSDEYKYLKNDYLTVTVWKIISDVYEEIGLDIPNIRELNTLIEGNDAVWDLYANGIVSTLNQAGTDSGKPQVMKYKPRSVRELSGWISAIRPAFSSMKSYFLNREEFSYGIPEFDALLQDSDNFILYQENIMKALQYAGFSEDETYGLLKAISKKKEGIFDETIYHRFIEGFTEKTGSEDDAKKVWKIIEDSVGYGFNSSHAYSMAIDSLYGAYLKATYPLEYYTVVLNIMEDKVKIQSELINELPYFKIRLSSPVFGESRSQYSYNTEERIIYKGLKSIKYLNSSVSEELHELASKNKYDDFIDLLIDIKEETSVNTRQMDILIKLGFFERFGEIHHLSEIYDTFVARKKKKPNPLISQSLAKEKSFLYSEKHSDETKKKRVALNREYAEKVYKADSRDLPVFNMIDRISHEIDYCGYPSVIKPKESPEEKDVYYVLSINDKYTPYISLYNISNGSSRIVKIKKNKFFRYGEPLFKSGNIIELSDDAIVQYPKNVLVGEEWTKDYNSMEDYIERISNIYS